MHPKRKRTGMVILLVRMWVEMLQSLQWRQWTTVILLVRMWVEILFLLLISFRLRCHPPCEDVSWNITWFSLFWDNPVILLVRMWVEIYIRRNVPHKEMSSSLWGCELKSSSFALCLPKVLSSSLWGCELKYSDEYNWLQKSRHPPCEDVSWNFQ